jgi:hypothetical protein
MMRRFVTGIALLALLAPGVAAAEECGEYDGYRNFFGKVDRVNKKELIVDNRKGDKLKFKPAKDVAVEGEKDAWKRVRKSDWVIVAWKMMDNPRIAYKVCVKPEQKEAGEDVE